MVCAIRVGPANHKRAVFADMRSPKHGTRGRSPHQLVESVSRKVGQFSSSSRAMSRGNFGTRMRRWCFHHARRPSRERCDKGLCGFRWLFDAASNFLTATGGPWSRDEAKLHGTHDHGAAVDWPSAVDDRRHSCQVIFGGFPAES